MKQNHTPAVGRALFACVAAAASASGCATHTPERLNSPPQGDTARRHRLQQVYAYQTDNALLRELSLNDSHFVANQPYLNGVGEARVARYAELLAEHGGTLRYAPPEDDKTLTDGRLAAVNRFLMDKQPTGKKLDVEVGMPAGRVVDSGYGMEARRISVHPQNSAVGIIQINGPATTAGATPSGGGGASSAGASASGSGGGN